MCHESLSILAEALQFIANFRWDFATINYGLPTSIRGNRDPNPRTCVQSEAGMTDDLCPLLVSKEASPVRNRRVGLDHNHRQHRQRKRSARGNTSAVV